MFPSSSRRPIRTALVGIGNCASALVQGLGHYGELTDERPVGLMHRELGGYTCDDVRIVAAWDVDARKVGRDVAEAIFAPPNCTQAFFASVKPTGVRVDMGPVLDGVSAHMATYSDDVTFRVADDPAPSIDEVVKRLRDAQADVLVNYLPVGSEQATAFYAEAALRAGVAVVNAMPVFLASSPVWADRFARAGVPIIGDDIKAQIGATIVHRALTDLFAKRGVRITRTYQLNTGGNTDFLNMLNRDRLASKKISKTEAVQAVAERRLDDGDIHVGPSDWVPWLKDNKVCFLRMEGEVFGGVPMNLELRLSVEDSPNSAGVAIDMIRCAKIARDRGLAGPVLAPSAFFCKHPPRQTTDDAAFAELDRFVRGG